MMSESVLTIALRTERDVVQARQRARELAALLGFDNQDQIRLATATSEIARNAFRYAREGHVQFSIQLEAPQQLQILVSDAGPGIRNLDDILDGRYKSETGMGMGIIGTRRLMDEFDLSSDEHGTRAHMSKRMPRHAQALTPRAARNLAEQLRTREPETAFEEVERQNQELMKTLQELRARQEELALLNRELEDTNRGVVALYAELDERADYLRRASELKTKFLSNVSHEFRTPLNSIISLARMLMDKMDGELSSEQEKQVRYIESSARDLQEMVNDLLDLAKVEAGKIKIRVKTFEVHELFSALKGMLKPLLADNTAVDLTFEDPVGLDPLRTDEGKVSQIVRNLISNALKFTPTGRVSVCARAVENGRVLFEVADTGIGIPPEHHETIFQEFSQIENPLQDRHRGTGLGLPLCRNLTLLLGGRLWLESTPGQGSTFFVEIPAIYVGENLESGLTESLPVPEFHRAPVLIIESNQDAATLLESYLRNSEFQPIIVGDFTQAESWIARHTPAAVMCNSSSPQLARGFVKSIRRKTPNTPVLLTTDIYEGPQSNEVFVLPLPVDGDCLLRELRRLTSQTGTRRLLIADDNEVSRYIVRELLNRPWLEVSEARNGSEALDLISEFSPDAVILDLLMPDISGMEVLRRMRASSATESLPVMIYTSKTLTDDERTQLQSLGAKIVRKEEISTRLSAQPFLDWLNSAGVNPEAGTPSPNV
jgi:signal transduction histidine kinase/DNA-binding response OmpR family regulator